MVGKDQICATFYVLRQKNSPNILLAELEIKADFIILRQNKKKKKSTCAFQGQLFDHTKKYIIFSRLSIEAKL